MLEYLDFATRGTSASATAYFHIITNERDQLYRELAANFTATKNEDSDDRDDFDNASFTLELEIRDRLKAIGCFDYNLFGRRSFWGVG